MDRSESVEPRVYSRSNSPEEGMSTNENLEREESPTNDDRGDENRSQNDQLRDINTETNLDTNAISTSEESQNDLKEAEVTNENADDTPDMAPENNVNSTDASANNKSEIDELTSEITVNDKSSEIDKTISTVLGYVLETDQGSHNKLQVDTQVDTEVYTIQDTNDGVEDFKLLKNADSTNYTSQIEGNTETEVNENIAETIDQDTRTEYIDIEKNAISKESELSEVPNLNEDGLFLTYKKSTDTIPDERTHPEIDNQNTETVENINLDAPINITTSKSTKRKRDDFLSTYEPIDSVSFKPEINKKRIAGKFIDKFWGPLDDQCSSSLDKILNMCVNRTIEKYRGNSKISRKTVEAQHLLSKNWTNDMNRRSFRSRLNVTNVPLPPTMQSMSKSIDSDIDILNYDHLTRRMQFLETYLLAELKQLSELESYYSDLELIHNLDLNYLNEFRRTTEINKSKMIKETITKRENLSLDDIEPNREDIKLVDHSEIVNSSFDPNSDKDTQEILHLIDSHLGSLSSDTSNLTNLNEKLETLFNFLNKC